jgi:hypothetical protein
LRDRTARGQRKPGKKSQQQSKAVSAQEFFFQRVVVRTPPDGLPFEENVFSVGEALLSN